MVDTPHDDHGAADTHEPLILRRLLEEPMLRGATVHADDADLDRLVEWCLPLSVVAASADHLAKVVVHADHGMGDDEPERVERCVQDLTKRGAVALAVSSRTDVPFVLRNAARERRLPLLVVAPDTSYHALSRLVAEKTIAHAAHVLQYGVTVHQALGEVLYRGAGLDAMARQIMRLSGCHVFVLDTQLEVLARDAARPDGASKSDEVLDRVRDAARAGGLESRTAGRHGHATTLEVDTSAGGVTCVVAPIVLGETTYGWVVLVENEHPPRRHDLAQHLVVAEQGATITGSEMLRLRSVEAAEERARGDFVHALLHGRFASSHELSIRAAHHGFQVDAAYGVIVAQGSFDTSTTSGLEQQNALLRHVRRMTGTPAMQTLATTVGDLLVVVRQVAPPVAGPCDTRADQDAVAQFAAVLDRELRLRARNVVHIAYGRPGLGAAGVASSYRDARVTLGVAQRLGMTQVCGYSELRVYAALSELADSRQALGFAREILEPLRRHDESGGTLESVVMAYIESGANLNAAARALHLHRNTMSYKLERASRLIRLDLRDPDALFTIWLAHRIDLLARVHAQVSDEVIPLPGTSLMEMP